MDGSTTPVSHKTACADAFMRGFTNSPWTGCCGRRRQLCDRTEVCARPGRMERAGVARAQQADIVIGAPNALTGGLGEVGSRGTWGMQIAVDQINREGGIKS